jgi:tRNA G18 (ribose-2'-O)-methylase SpoU
MGPVVAIDQIGDERVAEYRNLTDAELRRQRPSTAGGGAGSFIVEGTFAIRELLRSRYPVRSLLLSPTKRVALEADLANVDAPVFVASPETMSGIAGFNVHRGALASAARLPMTPAEAVTGSARLLAVLEGINDLENLGALFRNAAAFAIDGVLLCPRSADPLYRRCVRVSVGQVLHVPWTRVAAWPGALHALRADGFELIALTPDRSATPLSHLEKPAGGSRRALLLGAEGPGLSKEALAAADQRVRIPLAPGVDSLNVATAAALAFYQCASPLSGPS